MSRTWRHQWADEDDELERAVRAATEINCKDPSLTQQQFTDDCNLNIIAKRYGLDDGSIPPAQIMDEIHDIDSIPDFRTAHDIVHQAHERFMQLPADIRARFANRADIMHDWVLNPANHDEAKKLGFITSPEAAPPPPTPPPTPHT